MKGGQLLVLVMSIASLSFAQKTTDTELWTGGSFQLRVNKPLSFEIEEQFRFNDTISQLYKSFTELGIKYRLGNGFSLKGMFRHSIRTNNNTENRLAFDMAYGFDKKGFPLTIDYRLRFQDKMGKSQTYLRNKLSLGYKMSKLVDPYVAYEIFYRFNGKNELRKTRFTLGLEWRLMKELDLKTYYRIQNDINVKNPERQRIYGVTLAYTFKLDKKKTD